MIPVGDFLGPGSWPNVCVSEQTGMFCDFALAPRMSDALFRTWVSSLF